MSFDWVEFLAIAKCLESRSGGLHPREAALRSAASRAYYAAFHCAKDVACKEGFVPTGKGDDHWKVREHFRGSDQFRQKIFIDLDRLSHKRIAADYDGVLYAPPGRIATEAILVAERLILQLRTL